MKITAKLKPNPNTIEGNYDPDVFAALGLTEEIVTKVKGKEFKHTEGKKLVAGDKVTFGEAHKEILWRHGIYDEESFKEKLGWMFDVGEEKEEKEPEKKKGKEKAEGGD